MSEEQFGLLFIALFAGGAYWFRQWYHGQPRNFKVSEQFSGGKMLTITEINPRWETAAIDLTIVGKDTLPEYTVFVEFISSKGENRRLSLSELGIEDVNVDRPSGNQNKMSIRFEKRDLMRGIRHNGIELNHFRFVLSDPHGRLIKSHIFRFSSKYMLFKPDTGRYN